jgi:hypothetical protein
MQESHVRKRIKEVYPLTKAFGQLLEFRARPRVNWEHEWQIG